MLCPYKYATGGMIHVKKIMPAPEDENGKRRDIMAANPDTCGCEGEACAIYDEKAKACSLKNK